MKRYEFFPYAPTSTRDAVAFLDKKAEEGWRYVEGLPIYRSASPTAGHAVNEHAVIVMVLFVWVA